MCRALLALGIGLLAAAAVRADIGPPRQPVRVVPLAHKITTDKDYPDHLFFVAALDGPTRTVTQVVAVKLGTKTPLEIPGAAKAADANRECVLVAVPKAALKGYATEKAFLQALVKGAVEGQVQSRVTFAATAPVLGAGGRETAEWKLERIDKDEVVVKVPADPRPARKGGPNGNAPEDENDPESNALVPATAPRGGAWVAGSAAALALTFGGLWAVGRTRRKP